jgi:hypothetical protein
MIITLPSGRTWNPPVNPYTWFEQSLPANGWPLSAGLLEDNVGTAVAFHRQRPFFQGITNVATSLVSSTWTPMPIAEMIDTPSGHNDSTNTSRWYAPYTVNTTDWYLVMGYVPMSSASVTGVHIAGVRVDGGTPAEGTKITSGAHTTCTPMVVDLVQMTSDGTHYLELMGWQSSGAAVSTPISGKTPSLSVQWACSGSGTPVALPAAPHTWAPTDAVTADTVGGASVPLNREIRDTIRFLNYSPTARVTSVGTTQQLVSGTGYTSIQMTASTFDNYSGHSNTVNNTRYTFPRDGLYMVAGQYSTDENGGANTGYRSVRLLHTLAAGGSVPYYGTSTTPATTSTIGTHLVAAAPIRAVAGDYVEVQGQQSQGANRNVLTGSNNCSKLIAVWVSQ